MRIKLFISHLALLVKIVARFGIVLGAVYSNMAFVTERHPKSHTVTDPAVGHTGENMVPLETGFSPTQEALGLIEW